MSHEGSGLGLLLKQARENKNLTQEDLALKIRKKRSYISRIENNEVNINLKTLQQIVEEGLGGKIRIEF